jgi:hypothetical protein
MREVEVWLRLDRVESFERAAGYVVYLHHAQPPAGAAGLLSPWRVLRCSLLRALQITWPMAVEA